MAVDPLKVLSAPRLNNGKMVLAFSGWMDGGDVSTGSVDWLVQTLDARKVAEIDPAGFYIYNFPGSMEISALFRPHVQIVDGIVEEFELPSNTFYCDEETGIVLFSGKEPNMRWRRFARCIFELCKQLNVTTLYFVGSYAGMVPHTRDPRLTSTVSDASLKPQLEQYGIRFSNYEGPASFATYLLTHAGAHGLRMANLAAEIPAYIEGTNPKSIEVVVRKLGAILDIPVDADQLREMSDDWEKRLGKAVNKKSDLMEHIHKLEEDYDNEVFDTQMTDLKEWLQQQGIRLD